MATAVSKWRPKDQVKPGRSRVLTAAAQRIDLDSKVEAQRQRLLRQNWQLQAWSYYDSIPELGFAIDFIAHTVGRMRIFVAALSESGKSDMPVAIDDPELGAPPAVIEACTNALRDLGNGRIELSNFMEALSINTSVTGESFLLGQDDPMTGVTTWTVRSIEEVVIYNDQVMLREGPMTNQGLLGLVRLDPDSTFVTRMWAQHPRFRLLAQSAMRRLANSCEDLMILRRIIRATGRSRLAGRGILFVPAQANLPLLNDDSQSGLGDDFSSKVMDAMITPIRNEGDASGVVPLIVEMDGEQIQHVKWLDFASTFDAHASAVREELVKVIAVGLDVPAEVVTGIANANHWTAYQISTDTFRQHIEPHVVTLVQMLTGAFLRPYFASCGLDEATVNAWIQRLVIWYDPTEAVTPTDLSKAAIDLYDRGAISAKTLRDTSGFADEDAPSADEFLAWLISKQRTWPVNISEAVIHGLDPSLAVPPVKGPPALPGIVPGPGGGVVDVPIDTAGPPVNQGGPGLASDEPPSSQGMVGQLLRMLFEADRARASVALTAAAHKALAKPSAQSARLSRQLGQIDADLMARLHVAANAAIMRQLEKAGTRVRAKVNGDKALRAKIVQSHAEHVMMILGREEVERTGLTASNLMSSEWESLKEQYYSWTGQAQKAALEKARMLAGGDTQSTAKADAKLAAALAAGWSLLQAAMDEIAQNAAYNPDPALDAAAAIAALNPDTVVPAGVIRAAVGIAGGASPSSFTMTTLRNGASVPLIPETPLGGIGTGGIVGDYLTAQGASSGGWTWEHGSPVNPLQEHEDLNGEDFDSWTSDKLVNTQDWPPTDYYFPGDHDGCTCQATPNWVGPGDVADAEAALAAAE